MGSSTLVHIKFGSCRSLPRDFPLTPINSALLNGGMLGGMKKRNHHATETALRNHLLTRQKELLVEIEAAGRAALSATIEMGAEVTDLKEQANRQELELVQDAEAQRDCQELRAVQAALARLDEGSFGTCVDCGQEIDIQRLKAMPSAMRCVECQSCAEAQARLH